MLYKLFILTVILIANIHFNAADVSPRSLLTAAPSDTDDNTLDDIAQSGTDDTTDDNGDDEVATLGDNDADDTDAADLTDDNDDNDEADDGDDNELDTFETTDSSDSFETTDISDSDSSDGSIDSIETTEVSGSDDSSANTKSASDSDSNDSDSDSDSGSTEDDTTVIDSNDEDKDADTDTESEEVDECIGLTLNDCSSLVDDDGDRECAFNSVTSDCYGIERREGKYGSGNFDDGYNAAKVKTTDDTEALNTIIACLGAIVAILLVVISGGLWCIYSRNDGMKKIDFDHEKERVNTHDYVEDDDLDHIDVDEVMVDVIEDVSPNMTGTNTGDRDPMLV